MAQSLADEVLKGFVDTQLTIVMGSAERPSELSDVTGLFTDYLEWRIGDFGAFLNGLVNSLDRYAGSDRASMIQQITKIATELSRIGKETGRKYSIHDLKTPQEITLIQSGRGEEGFKVDSEPYQPMILRDDPKMRRLHIDVSKVNINNINRQRRNFSHSIANSFYFGLGDVDIVNISLEPLDEKGRTIQDPLPLDARLQPIAVYGKSDNFPYRRG